MLTHKKFSESEMPKAFTAKQRVGTENLQFRRRIPKPMIELARGKRFKLEFPALDHVRAHTIDVVIANELSFTLGTSDKFVADIRMHAADSAFKASLKALSLGYEMAPEREINQMAEGAYSFYKTKYVDSSGLPNQQKTTEALCAIELPELYVLQPIMRKKSSEVGIFDILEYPFHDACCRSWVALQNLSAR